MKKLLSLLLALAMMLGLLSVMALADDEAADTAAAPVTDGIADSKAPVLTGLSVSSDTAKVGGTVEVTAEATDLLSGAASCTIEFRTTESEDYLKNDEFTCRLLPEYWDSDASCYKTYADGKLHGTADIAANCAEGVYVPYLIDLCDNAGNHIFYSSEKSSTAVSLDLPDFALACTVSVTDEGDAPAMDTTAPELTALSFSADTAEAGSRITVTAAATDDMSGVFRISISLLPADDEDSDITLECDLFPAEEEPGAGEVQLTGTLDINAYIPGGEYVIDRIEVLDSDSNSMTYRSMTAWDGIPASGAAPIDPFGSQAELPDYAASYTLTVTNTAGVDLTEPALLSLSYSTDTVTAGSSIEIIAQASDDLSGVKFIDMSFYSSFTDMMLTGSGYTCILSPAADGTFRGTLKIDQYAVGKTYVPYRIQVYDKAGNCAEYGDNTGVDEDITPFLLSFTVTNPGGWYYNGSYWYYYVDDTGDYFSNTTAEIGGRTYVFRPDGTMIVGWGQTSDGSWYYCNKSGVMQTGWIKLGSTWYYLDPSTGIMAADEWVGGYYLKSSGAMATGWTLDPYGDWYLFTSAGKLLTGWQKSGGYWYYLDPSTGIMVSDDWVGQYYLKSNGVMATGWAQDPTGSWFYFSSSGKLLTGWYKLSGCWYYMSPARGGAMATGWETVGSDWYYFSDSGVMQTGWKYINGSWFFFGTSGAMQTGWVSSGSSWYYLGATGAMYADGICDIGGTLSEFDANGVWLGYVTD